MKSNKKHDNVISPLWDKHYNESNKKHDNVIPLKI